MENKDKDFLSNYLNNAPVSLALIRALECRLMDKVPFAHPILDLGCGDGLFSSILFKNKDYIDCAIDISEREIELTYKKGVYREAKVGSALDIPYEDESFRFILANDVLEYVNEPEIALNEAWRVLKPGGILCFTVPTLVPKFHFNYFARFIETIAKSDIMTLFCHNIKSYFRLNSIYAFKKWDSLLNKSGFSIIYDRKYASLSAVVVQLITSFYLYRAAIYKKTLGRYIPFPALHEKIITPITSKLFGSLYRDDNGCEGENHFIMAKKI